MSENTPVYDAEAIKQAAASEARTSEMERIKSINAIATRHQLHEIAADFISSGKTAGEFAQVAVDEVAKRAKSAPAATPVTHLGMSAKEVKSYSIMKAYRALVNKSWKGAELELEASLAVADQLGKDARGFLVPWDIQTRANNTQTLTAGGALVATTNLTGSFIDILRARSVVMGLGAQMLSGLKGNVEISKQTGSSTFSWFNEAGEPTESEPSFGVIQLSPRTIGGAVSITRRMMMQSDPSIDALVVNDLSAGAALAIDIALLEGNGVNRPLGITATTGVNTQSVSSAGNPTWAEMVGFETALATDNALMGSCYYVTTPAVAGVLKTTKKDAGSGIFVLDGGTANGYPVIVSSQLSTNRIIFGNFNDLLIATWGVLDITADTSTLAASGGTVMRAFQDIDAAVRHPESFCINS